jgi:hypothetical protein
MKNEKVVWLAIDQVMEVMLRYHFMFVFMMVVALWYGNIIVLANRTWKILGTPLKIKT